MENNQLENEKSFRFFLVRKYWIDLLALIVIFTFLTLLRYLTYIDNAVLGTLIGAVIGYYAKDIRKLHS